MDNLKNSIKFGVITQPSSNTGDYQTPQSKTLGNATVYPLLILPYGMGANPPEGTLELIMNIMGRDSSPVAVPYLDKERLKLTETDVWIYSPKTQSVIKLNLDGTIEVVSSSDMSIEASGNVTINASGNVTVNATTATVNALTTLGDPLGVLPALPIARQGDVVTDGGGTPIGVIGPGSTLHKAA